MDKKNITCSECDIPDVGCWEQCKYPCQGCFGASFNDCFECPQYKDELPDGHQPIEDDMEGI